MNNPSNNWGRYAPRPDNDWDDLHSPETLRISSVAMINYCPVCGEEVSKEEVQVSQYKTNLEVTCPNHGVLLV